MELVACAQALVTRWELFSMMLSDPSARLSHPRPTSCDEMADMAAMNRLDFYDDFALLTNAVYTKQHAASSSDVETTSFRVYLDFSQRIGATGMSNPHIRESVHSARIR